MVNKQYCVTAFVLSLPILFVAGCSSAKFSQVETLKAPANEALIFFYRTGNVGGAIKYHVHDLEGKPVGYLGKNGDSFTITVPPGTRQFWSRAASTNDVVLNVEAGKVYYVKGTVNMGFVVGRPVLEQVDKSAVPQ